MVAAAKDYRLILTMPDSMSQERQMLKAYGAQLKLTPGTDGMGAIACRRNYNKTPNAFMVCSQSQIHGKQRNLG